MLVNKYFGINYAVAIFFMVRKPLEIFNLSVVFNAVCLLNVLDLTALRSLIWSFIIVLDVFV